ncbi:MAG: GTP pyrophosphokinase family protein [Oscillospiraceae bacterium]|nr:GTP pyrophosphokinase family protein [Oscillospiraceae bacterium]
MLIEKHGSIRLRDISLPSGTTPEQQELAHGMVRVNHLYRSALKVAVAQLEILDDEFATMYEHSPIHHIEYRIKTLDSIAEKLTRQGYEVTIDNIFTHIQDVAGIRVICNYLDDIYYMRRLLTRTESFRITREADYIKNPKDTGYRSLHLILDVPIVISEGTLHLPVEVQLRTIAMDMWASLEHELRYKSDRNFSENDAVRLRLCSDAIGEIDREMQNIYLGEKPEYEV